MVEEHAAGRPLTSTLEQNYPNPFNAGTVIPFALPESEEAELAIFNLAGQKVAMDAVAGTILAFRYFRWNSENGFAYD